MAELADAHDSGSCGATHAGSSPVIRTIPSVLIGLEPIRTFFVFIRQAQHTEHLRPDVYVLIRYFQVIYLNQVFQ